MKKILIFLIIIVLIPIDTDSQVVDTQFGKIQGSISGKVYQFLGIPFAKPPVKNLRWVKPSDPDSWEGIRNTTSFSPVCPQKLYEQGESAYILGGNEDCLYLNVWTPQTGTGNRPVMVFFHGGGNQQGSASQVAFGTQMYFGKNLAERGNVVVVTIQYRLGALGFLVHPGLEQENRDLTSGNYGVYDQILALKWVQNNITNFGGNPSKVMIFGESAGGVDVGNLLLSRLATGLFQRACIQSAVPVANSYADSKNKGIQFVNSYHDAVGTDKQKIDFLRSLQADSLIMKDENPLSGGIVQARWQPVVDGIIYTNYPVNAFQSGNFNKVPLIIGTNSEEMSLSAPLTVTPAMVALLITSTVPPAYQAIAGQLYPPGSNNTDARKSYVGILTDRQFTVPVRRTAQCISQHQTEPVWRYFFTHKHTIQLLTSYGSYHGMELFYVFNNWENTTLGSGLLFRPQDDSVQNAMLRYWVNFAETGNPNGPGLANWPSYQSTTDCYLEMKATPNGNQCGVRTAQSDLWDNSSFYAGCLLSSSDNLSVKNNLITIFPNPTRDFIYINVSSDGLPIETELSDFTGRKLISSGDTRIIDLSGLNSGVYLLSIHRGNTVFSAKVIKL